MPYFIKFGQIAGNMVKCTPRVLFYIFRAGSFQGASTEKMTKPFQTLNGLNVLLSVT